MDGLQTGKKSLKNGKAKVTIVANQKTEKNVRADKYYKEASFNVTVKDEDVFSAKQTGVKKITVTGNDLTGEVKDYTLKRGEVKVTLEKVELAEDKKSAVLVAASAKYPAGDYVVTFGALTSDTFKVEDGKADKVVVSENLVLSGDFGVATTGTISYKVLNQFEENITKTFTTLNFTCTLGQASADSATGVITVKDISTYYQLGTTGKVVYIATDGSGLTGETTVTLSSKSVASDVELKGIYDDTNKKFVDLKANTSYAGKSLVLVVDLKDQYGNGFYAWNSTQTGDITLIVNPLLTNFKLANANGVSLTVADYDWTIGGFKIPVNAITGAAGNEKLAAGTVTLTFVLKSAVKNITKTFDIAATSKVASIDVYPNDSVYQGDGDVEFGYTAADENGNAVKSYALLTDANYGVKLPSGFSWAEPNHDDVAVLYFDTDILNEVPEGITGYYTQMVATQDYKFTKTISFNYSAAGRPAYVLGVTSATGVVSGSGVANTQIGIDYESVKISDQYGRVMSKAAKNAFGGTSTGDYRVAYVAATGYAGHISTTGAIDLEGSVATFAGVTVGTDPFTFQLEKYDGTDWNVVKNSDVTVKFTCVDFDKLAKFEVAEIGTLSKEASYTAVTPNRSTRMVANVTVYGYNSDGLKIKIPASTNYYTVEGALASGLTATGANATEVNAPSVTGAVQSKEYDLTVKINNGVGTAYTQKVTVKYELPVVKTVGENLGRAFVTVASDAAIDDAVITAELNAVDQFGYKMGTFAGTDSGNVISTSGHEPNVYIYDVVTDGTAVKVENNNTKSATISVANAAHVTEFMAKLTFDGGVTYTTKVLVR